MVGRMRNMPTLPASAGDKSSGHTPSRRDKDVERVERGCDLPHGILRFVQGFQRMMLWKGLPAYLANPPSSEIMR